MATVSLIDISKSFSNQKVLNSLSLHIEKGQFVAVLGPSGCGKSTLLRLVAGLDEADSGKILINDVCVNHVPPAKRDMAMVFQNYALYPHMTVYDNMAYGLKMRGMSKLDIRTRVHEVANILQIQEYLLRKPPLLSGGQRQRVAMGRAMVRSPSVFLFDEPLSNLDVALRAEMRHEIKKLHQTLNTTCLYVTHDQTEAMTMADQIIMLNHGKIEQIGTPQELFQRPDSMFVAQFLGHYPINFIDAKIDRSRNLICLANNTQLDWPNWDSPIDNIDTVKISVRPEYLHVCHYDSQNAHLQVKPYWMDDMGADKLVQVVCNYNNQKLSVRVFSENLSLDDNLGLNIDLRQANIFCPQSGRRIGGWNSV